MALSDDIKTAATTAKRLKTRDEEVEKRSIAEMIAADKYASEAAAVAGTKRRGLIITKMRPPGST